MPLDADTIVPYENTDRGESDVKVFAPSAVGQHIRRIGEDIRQGLGCSERVIIWARAISAFWQASGWTRCWSGPGLAWW